MGGETTQFGERLGPLRLTLGTTKRHILVYYFASVTSLILFTFAPQAQPFVLTELLGIAESEQGVLSGNVALFAEIVILAAWVRRRTTSCWK